LRALCTRSTFQITLMKLPSSNAELVEHLKSSFHLTRSEEETAFRLTDRKNFALPEFLAQAYADAPRPTLQGQTISAPGVVAIMTEALEVKPGMRVLEVGAGSGYQAAILSRLAGKAGKVFSMERIPELAARAKKNLKRDGANGVEVICGDGSAGLAGEAPFDRIIVTAAARKIPEKLAQQLKDGGKMVLPVGQNPYAQSLLVVEKNGGRLAKRKLLDVVFVPLVEEQ